MGDAFIAAVWACSVAILDGEILHASDVTAGNGLVIDWREVKSGEIMDKQGDSFDSAYLFVWLVGVDAAQMAVAG